MECVVLVDDQYAATLHFHDVPRADSRGFVVHLGRQHGFTRILLVSGDRESEVRRLAQSVGIGKIYAATSPEDKVDIVRRETARAKTVFVGDGINDAPALLTATVGVAFGQQSDVTAEAAGLVIVDTSLSKVDDLIHISRRLRTVAIQSAVGGMMLSLGGMLFAAAGMLTPVAGAVLQEGIDLLAVLNALRTASDRLWRNGLSHVAPVGEGIEPEFGAEGSVEVRHVPEPGIERDVQNAARRMRQT